MLFFSERELKRDIARHIDASSVVETLIYHGELANEIARLAAIVVKNKSKCDFSWYVLLSITSTRHYSFPKHFFELILHIKGVCKRF